MMATISASRILETLVFPGILGYFGSVVNALSDTPSEEDYIRRALHQATVLGNYVYIDGGEISQFENNQRGRISDPVNSTLSIDISLSWSTDNVEIRRIEKPREIPGKSRGYLWTDFRRQEFYIWGGFWPYEYKKADFDWVPIAKFKADGRGGGDWSLVEMADERMFRILRPTEMGAFTQVNSTAFLIGGQVSDATDQRLQRNTPAQALPGMMTFDFESRAVQNSTALNFSPFGSETRLGASAIHVPSFGPNGLVFVMGGHQPPLDSAYSIADTRPVSFSSLTFFDPVTRQSFTQTTTGDIPRSPRRAFCTVGFATEGGYDIFLFGGDNAVSRTRYDDAYILSLPGFHWTKLPSSTAGLRAYHACVPVGKRQVLNVGGNFQEGNWGEPDPANRGLLLFDMTTLQWKNDYDAKAGPYERADRIKTWYQNGSLANVQWSSEEVQKMFATQNLLSPGPDNAVSTGPAGSTPVGAIAGGVVGGIAGVAVIVLVIWLLVRRRKKQHQQSLPGSQQYYQHELRPLKELKEGRNIHMMPNSRGPLEMSTERSAGELPGYSVKPPEPNYQQHYVALVELDSGYAGPDRV